MSYTIHDLAGRIVWLRGTGNNSKYATKTALMARVSRVNAALIMEGHSDTRTFRFDPDARKGDRIFISEGCNSGYEVFVSEEELNDRLELEKLIGQIVNEARFTGKITKLGLAEARKISSLLNGHVDDELVRARGLLVKHGICEDCGEIFSHAIDEPFANCGCKQVEWHGLTPYMKLEKRIEDLMKEHNLYEE